MSPPWMPLYVADYLADTGHLSAAESGAYLHLIMHYWRTGGQLPKEDASLARIARMSGRQWSSAKETVLAFFDADLRHKRIDTELEKTSLKARARAECGARGGKAKALKIKNDALAKATILPEQTDSIALASSSQPESELSPTETKTRARRALSAEQKSEFDGSMAEFSGQFWPAWPHKVGKPDAAKAFLRARRAGAELDAILAGVERYVRDKPPDRPWLNPATFLNQRRWEDMPAPEPQARAWPPSSQGGGWAEMLMELEQNKREQRTESASSGKVVHLLPERKDEERRSIENDGGGLFGNAATVLVGDGFRRM